MTASQRALVLAASVCFTLAGCAASSQTPGVPQSPLPTTTSVVPTGPTPTPFPRDDAFAGLVGEVAGGERPAGSALDVFWEEALTEAAMATPYAPPSRVVAYRGGEIPESPCAARTSAGFWRANARYCESDRSILYDESWLRGFEDRFGAFAPAAILSHEWGHHVQSHVGTSVVSNQFELQADCFAGMFLAATEEKSPGTYVIGGEVDTALQTFFEIGTVDYQASEWFAAGEHGSRSQRMMALATGYLSVFRGFPWCYGYRDFTPRDVATIGRYQLLNLPGRTETQTGSGYLIHAEKRAGSPTSDVVLAWLDRLPLAGKGATLEQVRELWKKGFPGLTPIGDPFSLDANVDGTGISQFMENRIDQPDGSVIVQHGFFALVSPPDGMGGLLILSIRDGPAPTEMADLPIVEVALVAVHQVTNRLCGPDQSGDPGDPNLNVACLPDQ